ncbi:DUF2931 family protein [Lelliottia nimipressuralis]|uniref:DUF2931 family protein n=1 Tax=Lelliottia nimipressuralis TaxID=69220 RepID=A0ABD4KAC2_9ENTR|nr:DUF2931 family protein [Lelliottia nimipressuralis]MBF4178645.1 DUF2931 family protein [Lelliottia nimipressuralis]
MKSGKRIFILLLLAVAGCRSAGAITPEETGEMPYGLWEFAFFTPKALPALVTYVGIIDDKNIIYSFRTLDSTQDSWVTVGTWSNKVRRHAQFNKARHPPVAMLFCWDSTIDKKTYETRIIFPEALRSRMSVSTGVDRYGEKAWYDTLLFGLAPGGKVKVWLQNTVGGNGTIPVEPKKITTLTGEKLDGCKGITKHSKGYRYSKTTQEFIKDKTYPYGNW